jgi:large conductance mechanosensitive channel
MRNLLSEFRQFILRGNMVDLAVGIVIGVAFAGVVQALVRDFINPLIAALFGKPDFGRFHFT